MAEGTDGPKSGPSSDDLIRQARTPYTAPSTEPPPAPAPSDPGIPTASPAADPAAADSKSRREPLARPADGIGDQPTFDPAPIPSHGTQYETADPSFLQQYGKLLLFGGIGLAVLLYAVLDKTKSVEDLSVGDCLLMPETDEISSVESIDCDSGHELEVFALVTLPDGKDAPYPGRDAVGDTVHGECLSKFQA
jgi:hypothetical protein